MGEFKSVDPETNAEYTLCWVAEGHPTLEVKAEDLLLLGMLPVNWLEQEYNRLYAMRTRERPGFLAWLRAVIKNVHAVQKELTDDAKA